MESREPPPLILLSFADEEDIGFYFDEAFGCLSQNDLDLRADTMRRRLNSRCKGFLEVGNASIGAQSIGIKETVQYLHRTVKEYIESKEVQHTLLVAIKADFDPYHRLCIGSLAYLKAIEIDARAFIDGTFWARAQQCLYNAARIHSSNRESMVQLLDELDKTGSTVAKRVATFQALWAPSESSMGDPIQGPTPLLESGQWIPVCCSFMSSSGLLNPWGGTSIGRFGQTFLSLAVRYGIIEYVKAKANRGCLVQCYAIGVWPLLYDALTPDPDGVFRPLNEVPSLDMINCLLSKGADPNFSKDSCRFGSVWNWSLNCYLSYYHKTELKSSWLEIAGMMILHGAKFRQDLVHDPERRRSLQELHQLLESSVRRPNRT